MLPKSKWPVYSKSLADLSAKILLSGKVNYWTGIHGKIFEKEFSKKFKIKYSAAVSNGSIGLEIALMALGIKSSDEVIVTSRSYYSSVSSIIRVGAKPVFADIDSKTMNISPISIKENITKNTKAIICVHLYGMPCDMKLIQDLVKNKNIKIVEDCSQAHGAEINSIKVGSFGDIAVWSFCNDKIISTGGEGGMISTNNKKLFNKVWSYKEIGKNLIKMKGVKNSSNFPYIHDFIGTNARMTEIQSLIGRHQLRELDKFIKIRNSHASHLTEALSNFRSIITPKHEKEFKHAFYRYTIILKNKYLKKDYDREVITKLLKNENIFCNVGGCPSIHKEKFFIKNQIKPKNYLKNTNYIGKNSISFQVDQTILKKDLILMVSKIIKVMNMATKS